MRFIPWASPGSCHPICFNCQPSTHGGTLLTLSWRPNHLHIDIVSGNANMYLYVKSLVPEAGEVITYLWDVSILIPSHDTCFGHNTPGFISLSILKWLNVWNPSTWHFILTKYSRNIPASAIGGSNMLNDQRVLTTITLIHGTFPIGD